MNPHCPTVDSLQNPAIHRKWCMTNSSVSNVFFSKPYQLGPVTSLLVDRLPPLYLRMCFYTSSNRWWSLQRNGCLAPYTTGNSKTIGAGRVGKRPTVNRVRSGWWWWWWWLRWLFFWWFYDLGWPNTTPFFFVMFVFLWLVRMVFATLKGALNVGKVCQGLAPKIIHIHGSSRDKTNPTSTTSRTKSRLIKRISVPVCPTCFPRLGTRTDRGMVRGCGCRGQETNMTWHQRFLKHTFCIILSDC